MDTNENTGQFNAFFGFVFIRVHCRAGASTKSGFVIKMEIFAL